MKLSQNQEYQQWNTVDRFLNIKTFEYQEEQKQKKEDAKQLRHSYHLP